MNILLVEDHTMFRESLANVLRQQQDMNVVGEAGSVEEAVTLVEQKQPDVVLMDYGLPDGNGVEATRLILERKPDTKIVFVTEYESKEFLFNAIRNGAKGYLLKNLPISKLISSIRALDRNEAPISRKMTAYIVEEFSRTKPANDPVYNEISELTLRELQILRELATNPTNDEISRKLYLSGSTVKNNVHNILVKLGLKNRREAAIFARTRNL